jgi:hypothetical protein
MGEMMRDELDAALPLATIRICTSKSDCFNDFIGRASWRLLALEARSWELARTIPGTVSAVVDHGGAIVGSSNSMQI